MEMKERDPIVAEQQDGGLDLIERLESYIPETYEQDGDGYYDTPFTFVLREAATALSDQAARIAELIAETHDLGNEICGCNDTIDNLNTQLTASRAECEGLRADKARMTAALKEAEGELYQVPPADAEQERVLAVVREALASLSQPAKGEREVLDGGIDGPYNESAPLADVVATAQPALRQECATEGCDNPASVHFVRGDIGSYYCHACYLRVQALAASTGEAGR